MLVSLKKVLNKAYRGGYAVGAFNTSNLETTQAIISAAEKKKSPVIISTSEKAMMYGDYDTLAVMIQNLAQKASVPVVLHMDHGRDMDLLKKAILKWGYTSVMIDASHLSYTDNVKATKQVVRWAAKKGVSVEAELGAIAGVEDYVEAKESFFTDPQKARDFVLKTGIDALAISIGTAHGPAKELNEEKLDIKRLKEISNGVKLPLVLHGASQGVPIRDIKMAIKNGIAKINIDTDLRYAFSDALRGLLKRDKIVYDPRIILGEGRFAIQQKVEEKITLFGGSKKA